MLKAAIVILLLATVASLFSGLVFLVKDQEVPVFHSQGWVRLSTEFGHVLSKEAKHF